MRTALAELYWDHYLASIEIAYESNTDRDTDKAEYNYMLDGEWQYHVAAANAIADLNYQLDMGFI